MIVPARILFMALLAAITLSVIRSSLDTPLWAIPSEVTGDVWFRTTLVDLYVSLLAFYAWVAYRERGWAGRIFWFFALAGLGSIAVASYCLVRLFAVPNGAPVAAVLLREEHWKKVGHDG